jgi:hypothetical protein
LEGWKVGRLKCWKVGRLKEVGKLESWKVGRLEGWYRLRDFDEKIKFGC